MTVQAGLCQTWSETLKTGFHTIKEPDILFFCAQNIDFVGTHTIYYVFEQKEENIVYPSAQSYYMKKGVRGYKLHGHVIIMVSYLCRVMRKQD